MTSEEHLVKLTDPGPILVLSVVLVGLWMFCRALYDGLRK